MVFYRGDLPLVLNDVIEEFTALSELHNNEELLGCLKDLRLDIWINFIELNEIGMTGQAEYVEFPLNSLDVGNVNNSLLVQDFDRDCLPSDFMLGLSNLTKCALPYRLTEDVTTNLNLSVGH